MKCKEIKNKLSALIDNEINDKERKIVEDHLLTCSSCQKELKRLEFLNSIVKEEIFDNPGSKYWKELTGNIMNIIRPAEEKQPFWRGILDKIKNIFLPGRINYRIVGLAAATVMLIFFVKISFFNQGKFNLPMEMDKIESVIIEPQEEAKISEEEKITGKPTIVKLGKKKGSVKKTNQIIDGVLLRSKATEKRNSGTVSTKSKFQTKKDDANIKVEQEITTFNLAGDDKNNHFKIPVQNKLIEKEYKGETTMDQVGGIEVRTKDTPQPEMAIPPPSVLALSKPFKKTKKRRIEYQHTAIQANNSISKGDPFVIVLKEIKLKTNSEDKVKLLKGYLKRHPESVHKNQAMYLLAENLIQFAKETKSENNIKEAVEFFHKNETLLKTFDNFEVIKKDVKKLEKKM